MLKQHMDQENKNHVKLKQKLYQKYSICMMMKPIGNNSNINQVLSNIYFNIKNPASFKSALNLYEEAKKVIPNITYKFVKEWLINQETYTVHHRTIRNFKRSFMVSRKIDENWQTDLVEIENPEYNDGFKYLLMVIDVLSKYGWVQPIYDKRPKSIKKAFQLILTSKRKPKILTSD